MNGWLGEHLGSRVLASEARGSRSNSAELAVARALEGIAAGAVRRVRGARPLPVRALAAQRLPAPEQRALHG